LHIISAFRLKHVYRRMT